MRLHIGRLLLTCLAGLAFAGASACGQAQPGTSANPAMSTGAGDSKTVCDAVMKARATALEALAPVSTALGGTGSSAADTAKATDDLQTTFTAMHLEVAAAAEHANDPQLKAKLAAYQLSVEEVIVAVEGADGDRTKLAAAMALPALRDAEKAVMAACT